MTLPAIGARFDRLGHTYEVIKIGRDKARTLTMARPSMDGFGKVIMIDHRLVASADLARDFFKAL